MERCAKLARRHLGIFLQPGSLTILPFSSYVYRNGLKYSSSNRPGQKPSPIRDLSHSGISSSRWFLAPLET